MQKQVKKAHDTKVRKMTWELDGMTFFIKLLMKIAFDTNIRFKMNLLI